MANYIVQDVPTMPKGMRFQVVKTKMEVFADRAVEVIDSTFETVYFPTRKQAEAACRNLVKYATEPIFGTFSMFYVRASEVAAWLSASGRLPGCGERAFEKLLSKRQQAQYRIDFAEAAARLKLEQVQALGFNSIGEAAEHQVWLAKQRRRRERTIAYQSSRAALRRKRKAVAQFGIPVEAIVFVEPLRP